LKKLSPRKKTNPKRLNLQKKKASDFKKMKRFLVLLVIFATLFCTASCGGEKDRTYDEAVVKNSAKSLIKRSSVLNEIIWGKGILYDEDPRYQSGVYYPANLISQREYGVESFSDIIEMCEATFSVSYVEYIKKNVLTSSIEENGRIYTRYYQGDEALMVYSQYTPLLRDTVEYLYDTMEVLGSKGEIVTVKIQIKVTRGELSQTRELEIDLIEEETGWRIDTPTYASYIEQK
jgi:hypothetical protein